MSCCWYSVITANKISQIFPRSHIAIENVRLWQNSFAWKEVFYHVRMLLKLNLFSEKTDILHLKCWPCKKRFCTLKSYQLFSMSPWQLPSNLEGLSHWCLRYQTGKKVSHLWQNHKKHQQWCWYLCQQNPNQKQYVPPPLPMGDIIIALCRWYWWTFWPWNVSLVMCMLNFMWWKEADYMW